MLTVGMMILWPDARESKPPTGIDEAGMSAPAAAIPRNPEDTTSTASSDGTFHTAAIHSIPVRAGDIVSPGEVLIHAAGRRFPWRIKRETPSGDSVYAASHVLVSIDADATSSAVAASVKELGRAGYATEVLSQGLLRISWVGPTMEAFPGHVAAISAALPSAVVEKDYLVHSAAWTSGETIHDTEDSLGHQWLYAQGHNAAGVVVAVVDTGVNMSHPDLAGAIYTNPDEFADGMDNDGNLFVDDLHGWDFVDNDNDPSDHDGHGTAVSGVIAGNPNNGVGVSGFAPGSLILPIRVLDEFGEGWTSNVSLGVRYARKMGAEILNASWGRAGGDPSSILEDEIKAYIASGGIFVAAAGNSGLNIDAEPYYPSGYAIPEMVVVGGLRLYNSLDNASNFGEETVDILAPFGIETIAMDSTEVSYSKGTSFSAPVVAAMLAVGRRHFPELSNPDLIQRLFKTGVFQFKTAGKVSHPGYPNLERFFNNTADAQPEILAHSINPDPVHLNESFRISLEVNVSDNYSVRYTANDSAESSHTLWWISGIGTLFPVDYNIRIIGMAGSRDYGTVTVQAVSSAPYLALDLPSLMPLDQLSSPITLVSGIFRGDQPIHISWTKNGYHLDARTGVPLKKSVEYSGLYTYTATNETGSLSGEFLATWQGISRVESPFWQRTPIMFGDRILLTGNDEFLLFDGLSTTSLTREGYWNRECYQMVTLGEWTLALSAGGRIYSLRDGEAWSMHRVNHRQNRIAGLFDNLVVVVNPESLHLLNPDTGDIESLPLPPGIFAPIPDLVATGDGVLLASDGQSIWRFSREAGWSVVGSPQPDPVSKAFFIGGEFLFFSQSGKLRRSVDGSSWSYEDIVFPDGGKVADLFVYDGRPSMFIGSILFGFSAASGGWSEVFDFADPDRINNPSSQALIHGNDLYVNGRVTSIVTYTHSAAATRHGVTVSNPSGSYFTSNLTDWSRLDYDDSVLLSYGGLIYQLTDDGFYRRNEDGSRQLVGAGTIHLLRRSRLYASGGHFFLMRVEDDWLALNPTSGQWQSTVNEPGFVFDGTRYRTDAQQDWMDLPEAAAVSPISLTFHGRMLKTGFHLNAINGIYAALDPLPSPVYGTLPFVETTTEVHRYEDPGLGQLLHLPHWGDFFWTYRHGWFLAVQSLAGDPLLYSLLDGWISYNADLYPYAYRWSDKSWIRMD